MPRHLLVILFIALACPRLLADGMMTPRITEVGQAATLVQSPKQEAILVTDGAIVTVTLRTHFNRGLKELVWIVPVPAEPTNIVPRSDAIFPTLDAATVPRFMTISRSSGPSFGCSARMATNEMAGATVTHKASGAAGIFHYDVLAATSARDLTRWLTDNGYAVPANVDASLAPYIEAKYHFLAMRVKASDDQTATLAPHPISYTYKASTLVYPMIISRVSAAPQNEIVLYIVAPTRYACGNWSNISLHDIDVRRTPNSPSGTSYEEQVQQLSANDRRVFITEFAADLEPTHRRPLLQTIFGNKEDTYRVHYLTRLRALIRPTAMDRDVALIPVSEWRDVDNHRPLAMASPPATVQTSALTSPALFTAGAISLAIYLLARRRRHRRTLPLLAAPLGLLAAAILTLL